MTIGASLVLLLSTALVAWEATCHSPNANECAHLIAGLSHWELQRFELYRVNPPLVRAWAAIPALFGGCRTEWPAYSSAPGVRPVFVMPPRFLELNGSRAFDYIVWGRLSCLPFFWLGAWVSYRWARELYGPGSGGLALLLWCTSPLLMGHAAFLTPDAHATALGLAASHAFFRWRRSRCWWSAFAAGGLLGLALLAKTTWMLLLVLWPVMAVVQLAWRRSVPDRPRAWPALLQLGFFVSLGLHVLNSGYLYDGTLQPLGAYRFVSRSLSGQPRRDGPGNRFADTWLAQLPVPFPRQFVLGLDVQKADFEADHRTYRDGAWRERGRWDYYLYGFALKTPVGTLVLLAMAGLSLLRYGWQDGEWWLIVPGLVLLAAVSAETDWNAHLRYALPVLPYALIWASRCAALCHGWRSAWNVTVLAAATWSAVTGLFAAPHSLSYFNPLAGGSANGHERLIESNLDWGQDLLFLKRWLDDHPETGPIGLAYYGQFNPAVLGIDFFLPTDSPTAHRPPGWYAISASMLHGADYWQTAPHGRQFWCRRDGFADFLRREPDARVGNSIFLYHVTE